MPSAAVPVRRPGGSTTGLDRTWSALCPCSHQGGFVQLSPLHRRNGARMGQSGVGAVCEFASSHTLKGRARPQECSSGTT